MANTLGDYLSNNFIRDFAIKSIVTILKLKSKTFIINKTRLLENLNLKVIEIFKYQFYWHFILGFLVIRSEI